MQISMPIPLWTVACGALLLLGIGWFLYEQYLHPAWRKQRRVMRACEKAFEAGEYRLERIRITLQEPTIGDLWPSGVFRSKSPSRYFTYRIEPVEEAEPDFSGMSRDEVGLVRRYLRRSADVPHHGKTVLHTTDPERSPAEGMGASA